MKDTNIFYILIVAIICASPNLLFSQNWKKTASAQYQEGVDTLDSFDSTINPVEELSLPITLPLVFHLVYPKRNEAPKKEEVEWQVSQLNKHFSLEEFLEKKDLIGVNDYHDLAVDTEIRFCLDKIFFVPSDSISFSGFNSIKNDNTKGAKPFKSEEYINIWVGQLSSNSGFAQAPGGIWETDGIVIDLDFFGQRPAPYNEGKTLTHLMGNYLGLKDLWGNNNCEDDGVADTPIHNAPNYNRVKPGENHISLCPGFAKEMYMNYMDNTVDSMLYMFTEGQKQRMHTFLRIERSHLLNSKCRGQQASFRLSTNVVSSGGLKAFPNPMTDQINIEYYDKDNPLARLLIHNAIGKLIYQEEVGISYNKSLSVKMWEAGIYIISIKGVNNHSIKIIKQ